MGVVEAIILGLVQGLTEFLPISSSGHVYLVPALFGWDDAGSGFTAVIQLGTLLAVFLYFWKDLTSILGGWARGLGDATARGTQEWKLAWGIIAGSVPIAIVGLTLEKQIDTAFRSPFVVAGTLAFFGILMGIADLKGKRTKTLADFQVKDGVIMGLWQCLALIPGSSRSGCTITGGLFGGFDRAVAARVSFLLSVPSVLASGLYKLIKERDVLLSEGLVPTVIATGVAFISGWIAIAFLMKFLQTKSTMVFVVYRLVLAAAIIVLVTQGIVQFDTTEVAQSVDILRHMIVLR